MPHSSIPNDDISSPNTNGDISSPSTHESPVTTTPPSTSTMSPIPTSPTPSLRRSTRIPQPSLLLRDFHCNSTKSITHIDSSSALTQGKGSRYPLSKFISYNNLSSAHHSFVIAISKIIEPTTYAQASIDPLWCEAMAKEL